MKGLKEKTKDKIINFIKIFFDKAFWKFILVGIVNTLFGASIMFILYNVFRVSYWISTAANYVAGSILSFFLNKFFTFQKKRYSWKEIVKFIISIALCYLIAYGGFKWLMLQLLKGNSQVLIDNITMVVGMAVFTGLNYCGQRFFVFRQKVVASETTDEPTLNE